MSKELELIRLLIKGANEYEKETGNKNPTVYLSRNNLLVIEKSLQRLESIDNAEPSEALECLEEIRDFRYGKDKLLVCQTKMHTTIKQALLKAQKEHKALEIIKEKYPNVVEVKLCKNYEYYKLRMSSKHDTEIVKIDWNDKSLLDYLKLLTEEEFNLLREVLE
jgi:hypothetical protein